MQRAFVVHIAMIVVLLLGSARTGIGAESLDEPRHPGFARGADGKPSYSAQHFELGVHLAVDASGLSVASGADAPSAWSWGLALASWGRPAAMTALSTGLVEAAEGGRVEVRRPGVTEWHRSGSRDVRHGFILETRPAGEDALLALDLAFRGNLRPRVMPAGNSVALFGPDALSLMSLGHFSARDARGEELDVELQSLSGGLRLLIDDSFASYPLSIEAQTESAAWTGSGDENNGFYANAIATAGDVNGDGYSDVIVGAWRHDAGAGPDANRGRAYLYLGSAGGLTATAAWTASGDENGAFFGWSVSTAGDVNGDGFVDVVIGAPGHDAGGALNSDRGRAYVYLGSAQGLGATPSWIVSGDQDKGELGLPVANAGDVNGDGYDDVLVAARLHLADRGRTYLYLGSANGVSQTASWTASGVELGAYFGAAIATAGDVNADGYADVIVGAPYENAGGGEEGDRGRAYLYLGSSTGLVSSTWQIPGDANYATFGGSVSTAGDVDGDSYADVLVAAPGHPADGLAASGRGRVYLYRGSVAGLATTPAWILSGSEDFANLGASAATAGDVNGDGFGDVLIGAAYHDAGQGPSADRGRVELFVGSQGGVLNSAAWSQDGDENGAWLGADVSTAGDVDGDGYSDVLLAAPRHDAEGLANANRGRAYLHYGGGEGLSSERAWEHQGPLTASFGNSLAGAGDANGDGLSDVLVGSRTFSYTRLPEVGWVDVFYGSLTYVLCCRSFVADGETPYAHMGHSVAWAGDVNGDGYSDAIVGAPDEDAGAGSGARRGEVRIYHGSASGLRNTFAWLQSGDHNGAAFGWSVASAGDVNGDGYSDVLIGAPFHDAAGVGSGRAYLYLGSATGVAVGLPAWTSVGGYQSEFGFVVASAGDVNGDGYSDVLVGAPARGATSLPTANGQVSLYLGSPSGLAQVPDWIAASDQAGSYFGHSLGTAGDVNGDGYADIVVGAPRHDAGGGPGSDRGRAFVYLGSAQGLSPSPAWVVTGAEDLSQFGYAVASAGDLNGDGFADLAVGAPEHWQDGRAYVYLGSASGLAQDATWFTTTSGGAKGEGYSVGSAGDVIGDGFADLLVGAPALAGSERQGRVELYSGNGQRTRLGGQSRIPRQARTDGATPITLLGVSDDETSVALRGRARTAAGRDEVKLIWEFEPLGRAFDGTGIGSSAWRDSGGPGATGSWRDIDVVVDDLAPGTAYHWRLKAVSTNPLFPASPWMSLAGNTLTEMKFRTPGCADADGDGRYGGSCAQGPPDCNDLDPAIWDTPGEARALRFNTTSSIAWDAPEEPGAAPNELTYDLLRSSRADDFVSLQFTSCVETGDGPDAEANDPERPAAGGAFFYLARARNACPAGSGSLGSSSAGAARSGRTCP